MVFVKRAIDIARKEVVVCVGKDMEVDLLASKFLDSHASRILLEDDAHRIVGMVRDTAVEKYRTFQRFDDEAKNRFFTRAETF